MADYSQLQTLAVEKEGKLLMVTLNRPDSLNAINPQMHHDLEDLFSLLVTDTEVNAVVLTGAGRAFCAGGDVKGMVGRADEETSRFARSLSTIHGARRLIVNMLEVPQPIVAAVNGDAVGLGATIALLCDVVIAADTARFADTHVKVGLVAGDGGAIIWPLLVGVNRAKEYLMTGDFVPAREAERIGLVNKVVPREETLAAAKELATRLANGATLAIRWTKASVNKKVREDLNLILDTSLALENLSILSEDHREGSQSFAQRRPAVFTGR